MERAARSAERLDDLGRHARPPARAQGRDQELRPIVLRIGSGLIGFMALGFLSVFAAILIRGA
jgi:hypothetical protein